MKLEDFLKMINNGTCPDGELRIVDIFDFRVKDKHLSLILDALKTPNNVRSISLQSDLTLNGIQEAAKFLEDNIQIKSFALWNEQFKFNKENDHLQCFVPVIQNNQALKRLHLSGIGVQYAGSAQFFEALKGNKTIEFLSLWDNYFNSTHVAHQIADLISNNNTLKTLNLSGHWFKKEGLSIIAGSLTSNTTLEKLDVSGTWVQNEGAILFANELAKNIHLKSIKFFNSNITALGAIALADSLLTNTRLNKLDLSCNSITVEGTLALAKALETNRALQDLNIQAYSANNQGVKAFADMLEQNTSLINFNYDSFYTKGDGKDKLRIDMGLTRNKIDRLKQQGCKKGSEQELQQAIQKLNTLKYQYQENIMPANFSDYLEDYLEMRKNQKSDCCAVSFWPAAKSSSKELIPDKLVDISLSKMNLFSPLNTSVSEAYPTTPLQESLIRGFNGFRK